MRPHHHTTKQRYEKVKADVHALAKSVGYKDEQLQFLPVSAFEGDNIKDKKEITWWTGDTILKAIDKFILPEKPVNLPLRWPIQDVYTIKGVGTVPVGKVECGIMKPGQDPDVQTQYETWWGHRRSKNH